MTLLTSHPEVLRKDAPVERWTIRSYRTFDDLHALMAELVPGNRFDALIHAAAVSDFQIAGVYTRPDGNTVSESKISSRHPELWLRLTPTPKLADQGALPLGLSRHVRQIQARSRQVERRIAPIAVQSRAQSDADLLVANTLEGKEVEAFIADRAGGWERVPRQVGDHTNGSHGQSEPRTERSGVSGGDSSCQQLRMQFRLPLHADQPLRQALIQISQFEWVQTQQVQDRRLQVADVELIFANVVANLVGRAVRLARP